MPLMDSDSDGSSWSGDAEAMKTYLKAMSPKTSPTPPAKAPAPAPTPKATFDNLFSKAGLDSDEDDTSRPSRAGTSVSSESKELPEEKTVPSPRPSSPRPPPGAKLAPPLSAFRSSLGADGSESGSESSNSSDIKPKHESVAKGFANFMQEHPTRTRGTTSEPNDSSGGSSRIESAEDQSRNSPTASREQSLGSGASPSNENKSLGSREKSYTAEKTEHNSGGSDGSRGSAVSGSHRSAPSRGPSDDVTSAHMSSERGGSDNASHSRESSRTPSDFQSRHGDSAYSDRDSRGGESSRTPSQKSYSSRNVSKSSQRSESEYSDSQRRSASQGESASRSPPGSKPGSDHSMGSQLKDGDGSRSALSKSSRTPSEGSQSYASAKSASKKSAGSSRASSYASARSKDSVARSREFENSEPVKDNDSRKSSAPERERRSPSSPQIANNSLNNGALSAASPEDSPPQKGFQVKSDAKSGLPPRSPTDQSKPSQENHDGGDQVIPKLNASRTNILQRLEERRRALQNQATARSQGPGSRKGLEGNDEEHDNDSALNEPEPLETGQAMDRASPSVTSPHPKPANAGLEERLAQDEPSSKLDSQSEDYDPRNDDVEKWKALVKRSALGSSSDVQPTPNLGKTKSGSSKDNEKDRESNLVAPPRKEQNSKENGKQTKVSTIAIESQKDSRENNLGGKAEDLSKRDVNEQVGWMPPALTTYGENKYLPEKTVDEKNDPPTREITGFVDGMRRDTKGKSGTIQPFSPPVEEIQVTAPPEDESSLGSMGFLFPKVASEPVPQPEVAPGSKKQPQFVTHRLKPTVAGLDYDYYKSWILPGPRPPNPKQVHNGKTDREDPPGTTTIFKAKRVVVDPRPPSPRTGEKPEVRETKPVISNSQENVPSETWAPTMPVYKPSDPRTTDEWEAWRQARIAAAQEKAPKGPKKPTRSDISAGSDWGPPRRSRGLKFDSGSGGSSSDSGGSKWIPPSRTSRLDCTGSVSSQPTRATKARSAYKAPHPPRSPPVVETVTSSSESSAAPKRSANPSQGSSSASSSGSSSPALKDDNKKSPEARAPSGTQNSSSSSSSSSGVPVRNSPNRKSQKQSSGDGGNADSSKSKLQSQPTTSVESTEVAFGRPSVRNENDGVAPPRTSDVEIGSSNPEAARTKTKSSKFSGCWICVCITLTILVLGGIVALVVLILTGRLKVARSPNSVPTGPSPTPAPIASHAGLSTLVVSHSPNTQYSLADPTSAQSRALKWLSGNQFLSSYSDQRKLQRFVLAVLYYSTNGDSWGKNDLWLSDIDECNWYFTHGGICDSRNTIVALALSSNALNGTLPWTEMGILNRSLVSIDFKENDISGSITDAVGELSGLSGVDLHGNRINGTIPTALGELASTINLDLSQNRLMGTIPSSLSSMKGLQTLSLNENLLRGNIPSELGLLTNLQSMYLSGNDFVGSMPAQICSLSLVNLEVNCAVTCSCCTSCGGGSSGGGGSQGGSGSLSGDPVYELIIAQYPGGAPALADASSPQRMAFQWLKSTANDGIPLGQRLLQRYALATLFYATQGNGWTTSSSWLSQTNECSWYTTANAGSVCDSNGNIIVINLQNNHLQGSIPMELLLLNGTLEKLNLSGNNIYCIIHSEMGEMSHLQRLELTSNNIFSTIPSELGLLSNLQVLGVGSNQLTGTIPASLGNIPNLAELSVYKNFLSGTIPSAIGNLSHLQILYTDGTDLVGPIPSSVCQLNIQEFWSDCQKTQCTCCTTCCTASGGCV